ncbi:uncharacterized protein [Setaria viridis]|uniref:uncharacterized protein n=1 Tax=Setaria viridis TaxID=4556 RepID=UPI003B3B9AEE
MTNEVGRSLFANAGELGVPVGIMVMKGIILYIQEIDELCRDIPETTVILDHMAFCKPPTSMWSWKKTVFIVQMSLFQYQLTLAPSDFVVRDPGAVTLFFYVKYSALFRISSEAYPYEDTAQLLSRVISNYGANRIMWGSDYPFIMNIYTYETCSCWRSSHQLLRIEED